MKKYFLCFLLLPLLAWSASSMKIDANGNPLLTQYSEEGFVDCVFRIVARTDAQDRYHLRLQASYVGQVVGMDVDVIKNIQGAFDADMHMQKEHVYQQGLVFHRSGPESDRLVAALAKEYGQSTSEAHMISAEPFTAIALHQGALDMEKVPVKLKIFGRDGEPFIEDNYYESYFNLDLKNGLVFWNEKDQGYRHPLIRALTGQQ